MTQHTEMTKSFEELIKTENPTVQRVSTFLESYKVQNNWNKVEEVQKEIGKCWDYIVSEAKKKAVNGQCCLTDEEVFNLAVHYYDENGEPEGYKEAVKPVINTNKTTDRNLKAIEKYNQNAKLTIDDVNKMTKTRIKRKKEEEDNDQLSLF